MAGESKKLYAEDDISKLAVLKSTDSIPRKVNKYLLQGVQKIYITGCPENIYYRVSRKY